MSLSTVKFFSDFALKKKKIKSKLLTTYSLQAYQLSHSTWFTTLFYSPSYNHIDLLFVPLPYLKALAFVHSILCIKLLFLRTSQYWYFYISYHWAHVSTIEKPSIFTPCRHVSLFYCHLIYSFYFKIPHYFSFPLNVNTVTIGFSLFWQKDKT